MRTKCFNKTLFISLVLILVVAGCKTRKLTFSTDYSDLPSDPYKLGEYIKKKNSRYNVLTLKNFKVKYNSGEKTNTFYGSSKILHDSLILVSLRAPLGIELSRILLSEDSVKVLQRSDNNAILSDYSYLETILKFKVNFHIIENVLSGNLPEEYHYLPQKTRNRAQDTLEKSMYIGRYYNKHNSSQLKYEAWINPQVEKVYWMKFYRKRNFKLFDVRFSQFMQAGNNYYPGEISIRHTNADGTNTRIKITISNFEESSERSVHFDIPSKYKIIRLN